MGKLVKVEIVKDNTKPEWEKNEAKRAKEMRTFGKIRVNNKDVEGKNGKPKMDLNSLIGKDETIKLTIEAKIVEAREDYSDPKLMNYEFKIVKIDFGGGVKTSQENKNRDLTGLLRKTSSN